jgi:hypothetical protein
VRRATALVACAALFSSACDAFKKVERRDVTPAEFRKWDADDTRAMNKKSPFLKAHMRNGDLFILQNWSAAGDRVVVGNGARYDPARNLIESGNLQVSVDSVAIFETNVQSTSGATAALTAFAVVTVGVAIACAINPKACFGSCPTFFVAGHARPLAEGFSSSIAPSLEATDVDALDVGAVAGGRFEIVMKNEAYETHVVRHVDLLAVPHLGDTSAFAALDGSFWRARSVAAAEYAEAPEGDCLAKLRAVDGVERFSLADSTDLAAKETVEVAFADARAGRCGIVIASRQSLLSTFLLYQTYAYMGSEAGYWLAELERGHLGDAGGALVDLVGGIVVSVEVAPGEWSTIDEVREFGPIAVDQHLVAFDAPATWTGRARLTMTKGAWRVDQVALAQDLERVEPLRLSPSVVEKNGQADDAARALLVDPERALTTLPGDAYTLVYQIPRDENAYDLFLESRGYYLEWIRDAWIQEENPARLAELFFDPETALVRLAPEYKRVEGGMERTFWESRYAKP